MREAPERLVAGVDQLAAVLVDLTVGEVPAARPAATADAARGLVDIRREPGLLQAIGGRQAGEPRPDDGDPAARSAPGRSRAGEGAEQRRACERRACAGQELAPRRAAFLVGDLRDRLFHSVRQRRARHLAPPRVDVDSLNVMHSTCSRKPQRPGEHGDQRDEHEIARQTRRPHCETRAHRRSSAAGTRPASGSARGSGARSPRGRGGRGRAGRAAPARSGTAARAPCRRR